MYGDICAFPHILGSPSSYMTLHPIPSEFPYNWGKFCSLFCQWCLWTQLQLKTITKMAYFPDEGSYLLHNRWPLSAAIVKAMTRERRPRRLLLQILICLSLVLCGLYSIQELTIARIQGKRPHCKKSWRSSSTPASGDAGPKHTGIEQIFRHPCRKFYCKYRTFPTFFTSVELVRQSKKQKQHAGREPTTYRTTICHSTTAPCFLMQLVSQ